MNTQAILCVDDEAILLMALRQELRSALRDSFIYEVALSAEDALETIERLGREGITLALIITDWLMPGMDGEQLLEIVHERYPATKSILITGHADDNALRRIIADKRNLGVLRKPWSSRQLCSLISEAFPVSEIPPGETARNFP